MLRSKRGIDRYGVFLCVGILGPVVIMLYSFVSTDTVGTVPVLDR